MIFLYVALGFLGAGVSIYFFMRGRRNQTEYVTRELWELRDIEYPQRGSRPLYYGARSRGPCKVSDGCRRHCDRLETNHH